VKMKLQMRGMDRVIAYLEKTFNEADKDNSGSLDRKEFDAVFSHPQVMRKLQSLGVSADDVSDLFEVIDNQGRCDGEITLEKAVVSFMQIRDVTKGGIRAITFLRKCFMEADEDFSGTLSKREVSHTFSKPNVRQRLEKMRLKIPDWNLLFDQLDTDGSGDLSWEEISEGMTSFWQQAEVSGDVQRVKHQVNEDLERTKTIVGISPQGKSGDLEMSASLTRDHQKRKEQFQRRSTSSFEATR